MQAKTSFLGVSLSFVLLFISTFSFGQTDTKEIDEDELKKYNMDALLAIL